MHIFSKQSVQVREKRKKKHQMDKEEVTEAARQGELTPSGPLSITDSKRTPWYAVTVRCSFYCLSVMCICAQAYVSAALRRLSDSGRRNVSSHFADLFVLRSPFAPFLSLSSGGGGSRSVF